MTYKLIKTDDYLLVVDDSEIKNFYVYYQKPSGYRILKSGLTILPMGAKNISSHLPLNGSPILEGVDLLPPIEDDEALIKDALSDLPKNLDKTNLYALGFTEGRISGYNKSRKKYKYTEKDMVRAIDMARDLDVKDGLTDYKYSIKDILEFHSDYATEFECEMEVVDIDWSFGDEKTSTFPKTITTAQGVQWVGKYK